jgi:Lrp/AsnC family transcriptional regulator, leucine-responsive regulatory protein
MVSSSSSARILPRARSAVQQRGQRDPGEDGQPAGRLRGPDRLVERDDAGQSAHERLEVDERARELRGHAHLGPCEEPEAGQRAGERQPEHRHDGRGGGRRRGSALGEDGHRQRREPGRAELNGGHRAGVAAGEQPRLDHDQPRRAGDRREHEQVAGERRAGTAAAGDEADAGERDERAGPRGGARGGAPVRRGDHGDEHRHGADHERCVADARALDPGVLEQDHRAVAERAGGGNCRRQRGAQVPAREQREHRRRDGEARHGQPAHAEPLQAELRQRHGEAPQRARGRERDDRPVAVREGHASYRRPIREIPKLDLTVEPSDETIFRQMAISLDEIDVRLLAELEADADRPNVALARLVGLSPAATLNRVRRLKESGVIRRISARLDSAAAGFPLQVYVLVTLARHEDRAARRFTETIRGMPQIIAADEVTGDVDSLLMIVARDVAELQGVLVRLSTRGGATRLVTLLRLRELKPSAPLPLSPGDAARSR